VSGAHHHTLRVYYEDTDAGGVVYHATYLRFAERARTEALRELGIPHAELTERHNLMFMVRRVEVDYLRPARVDDLLVVVSEPLTVGGASVVLRQDVRGADGLSCAVLIVRLACVRLGEPEPRVARLPVRWREGLRAMMPGITNCNEADDAGA
jgi:acyl-CoA thioester hydrolase